MKITLIGAGNVGYHLGQRLHKKGFTIVQVFSRTLEKAERLATKIGASAVHKISAISATSDIYMLAVKDDAIEKVSRQLATVLDSHKKLVVHTSGAASSLTIAKYFQNYGVFYPLQTFSITRPVKFSTIPICLAARRKKDQKLLLKIAKKISKKVAFVSDEERAILHVAAVFVNNFSNHLFHVGHSILSKERIDLDLLKPLILETVLKIEEGTPFAMQTGPAKRGDTQTIKKHLDYLQKFPKYGQLYTLITKSIQDAYRR
ncbi:MAG: DUF2520 domain-containing protein [Bacteroidota bacterium]